MNYRKTGKFSPHGECRKSLVCVSHGESSISREVKLKTRHLRINQYPEGLKVIISARRSPFVNFFLLFWMIGWIIGEIEITGNLINHEAETPDAFMVFWAVGWTLSGLLAVFIWLYNMKGREIVSISDSELIRIRQFVFFSRSKIYATELITNLRLTDINPSALDMGGGMEFWGLSGGTLTFDYGPGIEKFGLGIDEDEARQVIAAVKARFENF